MKSYLEGLIPVLNHQPFFFSDHLIFFMCSVQKKNSHLFQKNKKKMLFLVLLLIFSFLLVFCHELLPNFEGFSCNNPTLEQLLVSKNEQVPKPPSLRHAAVTSIQSFHRNGQDSNIQKDVKIISSFCKVSSLKVWLPFTTDTTTSDTEREEQVSESADLFLDAQDQGIEFLDGGSVPLLRYKISLYRGSKCVDLLHYPVIVTSRSKPRTVLNFSSHLRNQYLLQPDDIIVIQREYSDTLESLPNLVKLELR